MFLRKSSLPKEGFKTNIAWLKDPDLHYYKAEDLITGTTIKVFNWEFLLVKANAHTKLLRHRSSLLRIGGSIPGGVYDPGFEVEQLGAMMFINLPIIIEEHARIAQMTMYENTPVPEEFMYNGQFLGTKDFK